jgi:hypothetical protein
LKTWNRFASLAALVAGSVANGLALSALTEPPPQPTGRARRGKGNGGHPYPWPKGWRNTFRAYGLYGVPVRTRR